MVTCSYLHMLMVISLSLIELTLHIRGQCLLQFCAISLEQITQITSYTSHSLATFKSNLKKQNKTKQNKTTTKKQNKTKQNKKKPLVVQRNSTNTWFWRMQRIFSSFSDIFDLLNPNPNDASVSMLSVLRFG